MAKHRGNTVYNRYVLAPPPKNTRINTRINSSILWHSCRNIIRLVENSITVFIQFLLTEKNK